MAVKIRLTRMGRKKAPFYRIIVANANAPRDGRFIDQVGTYDPNVEPAKVDLDKEAVEKWLKNGAQPTEVVARLFKNEGLMK